MELVTFDSPQPALDTAAVRGERAQTLGWVKGWRPVHRPPFAATDTTLAQVAKPSLARRSLFAGLLAPAAAGTHTFRGMGGGMMLG